MDTRVKRVGALVIVVLLAGCASTVRDFRPVREIPELCPLQDAYEALLVTRGLEPIVVAGSEPVQVAWEERGTGDAEWLVVLVHGILSDSRTWRFVAGDLGEDHDLLLLDLPGCGDSDKPDPDGAGPDAYTPDWTAHVLLETIRRRLDGRPGRVALVGHSLGSTIALRMLGDPGLRLEYADVIGRIERMVLLSPVDFAVEKPHPALEKLATTPEVLFVVADWLGILAAEGARTVAQGCRDPECVPRAEALRFIDILEHSDTRAAAVAMIRRTIPYGEDHRPVWDEIEALERDYANVDVRCLILYGARDETFPKSMGYKLRAQLPHAWLRVMADCTHSLMCDAPAACAEHIRTFLETAGAGMPLVLDEVREGKNPLRIAREGRDPDLRHPRDEDRVKKLGSDH